jgi:hypothetical protein
MKRTAERPFANPEAAARKLVELASGIDPTMPDRIYIERSTTRCCSSSRLPRPNTRPGSTSPSIAAGSSWR